jgi:flagellar hook protein FlgE
MLRSMDSAVSGLRNHQVAMDVIGNNISNVNTVGFKAGRATFEESMAQVLQGATRPIAGMGGMNPMEVGLGSGVGSIDTMLTQGNLQTTGQITDLAIQGQAYFVYSNGTGNFYSRNGGLQFDATGKLVSPTNGFALQGMTAAPNGTYPPGSKIGDIRIPFGEKAPAQVTTEVKYQCNLDSDSQALGSITNSNRFLAVAGGTQTLSSLNDSSGNALGIQQGDQIIVSTTGAAEQRFVVGTAAGQINNYTDLATSVQAYLRANGHATATATVNAAGQLEIANASGTAINGLQIRSSRPISNAYVANAFAFAPSIPVGAAPAQSEAILRPAVATDKLGNVLDATGQPLGLEGGDIIKINGAVGGKAMSEGDLTYVAPTAATGTTIGDLINAIQAAFKLPATDGTTANNPSVSINGADTPNDQLTDGSIVVRGQPETAFAITGISITASNANSLQPTPARFIANMPFTPVQAARDTGMHDAAIQVYDQSGDAHTLTLTFTHSGTPNEWLWSASTAGGEQILGGSAGRITFGQDGSPASFTYDDGSTSFRFDPMNGSNVMSVNLNAGTPGSLTGITQFRSPTTTIAKEQNGYPMGKLQEIKIDEKGEISGIYTNGVTKSIARIYLAEFNNPGGLSKMGDSMYAVTSNSGEAVLQRPGVGTPSTIKGGAVEMSNVDLAVEFTNMIQTQRGYQANARVITTSDQLLQELVQLVR